MRPTRSTKANAKAGRQYLQQVGRSIGKLFTNVDPQAIWAMQSWSIRKEIATAVPKNRLLVLDLAGQRRDFWGYDFVVGQLHNFGGRINIHGDLADVADNKFAAAKKTTPQAVGMGLFMEGTMQNPVFYNLVFDMTWRDGPVDVRSWVHQYAQRRYGAESAAAGEAWDILLDTAYKKGTSGVEQSSIIAARPALNPKKSGPNAGFDIPYSRRRLAEAWELLLQDRERLRASDGYRFEVADVGRQVLSNLGQTIQKEVARAHVAKDKAAFEKASREFLELLDDVDAICATRNEYNFGKWVRDAHAWGVTDAEKSLYEYNAAMLLTLLGPGRQAGNIRLFVAQVGRTDPHVLQAALGEVFPISRRASRIPRRRLAAGLRARGVSRTSSTINSPIGKLPGQSNATTCRPRRSAIRSNFELAAGEIPAAHTTALS